MLLNNEDGGVGLTSLNLCRCDSFESLAPLVPLAWAARDNARPYARPVLRRARSDLGVSPPPTEYGAESDGAIRSGCKRGRWADALVNGGNTVRQACITKPFGLVRTGSRAIPMWKKTTIRVTITVNVASCLFGVAAILKVLF